jgi:hypothetical protein
MTLYSEDLLNYYGMVSAMRPEAEITFRPGLQCTAAELASALHEALMFRLGVENSSREPAPRPALKQQAALTDPWEYVLKVLRDRAENYDRLCCNLKNEPNSGEEIIRHQREAEAIRQAMLTINCHRDIPF